MLRENGSLLIYLLCARAVVVFIKTFITIPPHYHGHPHNTHATSCSSIVHLFYYIIIPVCTCRSVIKCTHNAHIHTAQHSQADWSVYDETGFTTSRYIYSIIAHKHKCMNLSYMYVYIYSIFMLNIFSTLHDTIIHVVPKSTHSTYF